MTAHDLIRTYREAKKRLLLLDYDGTLAEFKPRPSEARPTPALLEALHRLGHDKRNAVVIVSGRDRVTLSGWFGNLPIALSAEHGYATKLPGQPWRTETLDAAWKTEVRNAMSISATQIPGSFIEEKAAALVWHYRTAENSSQAAAEAHNLAARLEDSAHRYRLSVMPGNKIVEAKPAAISKGSAVRPWLAQETWDFILAAGDDTTDEDLFAALPAQAWTLKIGPGTTRATSRLDDPVVLMSLLKNLALGAGA